MKSAPLGSAFQSAHVHSLDRGFQLTRTAASARATPADLTEGEGIPCVRASVAQVLRDAGRFKLGDALDFDAEDFWYTTSFDADANGRLRFEGIGGVAEIFVNGELAAVWESMYLPVEVAYGGGRVDVAVVVRSLQRKLAERRGRPRWKTKLVREQQLRWWRQSLLGRMPGWSPSVPPLGLYRPVRRIEGEHVVDTLRVVPSVREGVPTLGLHLEVAGLLSGAARVLVGDREASLEWQSGEGRSALKGTLAFPDLAKWWPHTHGEPVRHELRIKSGALALELPKIGFRNVSLDRGPDGRGFGLVVNGERVFARGATWTTDDLVASEYVPRENDALLLARRANMNMIRVGGTFLYETDAFYDRCDELGILVFQDFMFANMDYPFADGAFRATVEREVEYQSTRFDAHASVVVRCGGSEVFQQAAMLGIDASSDTHVFFNEDLPRVLAERTLGGGEQAIYVPSTPSGGAQPFFANESVTHYYGLGAYLRPVEDVRRANVRFATECLAFSNVPEPKTLEELFGDEVPVVHHPLWKERVPRDRGAGWDFEEVRDHYFRELFGVEAVATRYSDHERYLAMSRVVPGHFVEQAIAEWRRAGSTCGGALLWFLKDLWLGAGWGSLDAAGRPKALHFSLERAFASRVLFFIDEGLNGLHLHLANDAATTWTGKLVVRVLRGALELAKAEEDLEVGRNSVAMRSVDRMLGSFRDLTYAYRFGPLAHDVVTATFESEGRTQTAFFFPKPASGGQLPMAPAELGLSGTFDGDALVLRATRFALFVRIDAPKAGLSDNYFHLAPNEEKRVDLCGGEWGAGVDVSALNGLGELRVKRSVS